MWQIILITFLTVIANACADGAGLKQLIANMQDVLIVTKQKGIKDASIGNTKYDTATVPEFY